MEIDRAGVEYGMWDVESDADIAGTPEVRIGTTWYDAEWVAAQVVTDGVRRRTLRLLLAGPEAPDTPGAVPVARGRFRTAVRVSGAGELPVRDTEDLLVD